MKIIKDRPADRLIAPTGETLKLTKSGDNLLLTPSTGGIELEDTITSWQNVIVVAKSGGDYTSIQDAIDSITDNADDNRYCVLIAGGTYSENVVGKNYVCLKGISARGDVTITSSTGPVYTVPQYSGSIVGITLSLTPITDSQILIQVLSNKTDNIMINNCVLKITSSTNDIAATIFDVSGSGTTNFISNSIVYTMTGNQNGSVKTHTGWNINGSTVINMNQNQLTFTIADQDDNVKVINDSSTASDAIIQNNKVVGNMSSASYSGTCQILNFTGTNYRHYLGNQVRVLTSGNGTGEVYYSNNGGAIIHSTGNHVHIFGFTLNRFANIVDVGDILRTHSDDVVCVDRYTGNGTIYYASSFDDGQFDVSDKLLVGDGTTNYMEINSAGTITLYGTAKQTRDVGFIVYSFDNTMANGASRGNLAGTSGLLFDDTTQEFASSSIIIPADFDSSVNPQLIIKVLPTANQTSGSTFEFESVCRYVADGESITQAAAETPTSGQITVSNTQYIVAEGIITLNGSLIDIEDHFCFILQRDVAGDDRNGDAVVIDVTFRYTRNKIGQ